MENVFINCLFPKKAKYDFIVTSIGVKVEEFEAFLKEHKEWATNENNGWLSIDVLKTKGDADKFYCKMTKYATKGNATEVNASSFMPDRETIVKAEANDDLPF